MSLLSAQAEQSSMISVLVWGAACQCRYLFSSVFLILNGSEGREGLCPHHSLQRFTLCFFGIRASDGSFSCAAGYEAEPAGAIFRIICLCFLDDLVMLLHLNWLLCAGLDCFFTMYWWLGNITIFEGSTSASGEKISPNSVTSVMSKVYE